MNSNNSSLSDYTLNAGNAISSKKVLKSLNDYQKELNRYELENVDLKYQLYELKKQKTNRKEVINDLLTPKSSDSLLFRNQPSKVSFKNSISGIFNDNNNTNFSSQTNNNVLQIDNLRMMWSDFNLNVSFDNPYRVQVFEEYKKLQIAANNIKEIMNNYKGMAPPLPNYNEEALVENINTLAIEEGGDYYKNDDDYYYKKDDDHQFNPIIKMINTETQTETTENLFAISPIANEKNSDHLTTINKSQMISNDSFENTNIESPIDNGNENNIIYKQKIISLTNVSSKLYNHLVKLIQYYQQLMAANKTQSISMSEDLSFNFEETFANITSDIFSGYNKNLSKTTDFNKNSIGTDNNESSVFASDISNDLVQASKIIRDSVSFLQNSETKKLKNLSLNQCESNDINQPHDLIIADLTNHETNDKIMINNNDLNRYLISLQLLDDKYDHFFEACQSSLQMDDENLDVSKFSNICQGIEFFLQGCMGIYADLESHTIDSDEGQNVFNKINSQLLIILRQNCEAFRTIFNDYKWPFLRAFESLEKENALLNDQLRELNGDNKSLHDLLTTSNDRYTDLIHQTNTLNTTSNSINKRDLEKQIYANAHEIINKFIDKVQTAEHNYENRFENLQSILQKYGSSIGFCSQELDRLKNTFETKLIEIISEKRKEHEYYTHLEQNLKFKYQNVNKLNKTLTLKNQALERHVAELRTECEMQNLEKSITKSSAHDNNKSNTIDNISLSLQQMTIESSSSLLEEELNENITRDLSQYTISSSTRIENMSLLNPKNYIEKDEFLIEPKDLTKNISHQKDTPIQSYTPKDDIINSSKSIRSSIKSNSTDNILQHSVKKDAEINIEPRIILNNKGLKDKRNITWPLGKKTPELIQFKPIPCITKSLSDVLPYNVDSEDECASIDNPVDENQTLKEIVIVKAACFLAHTKYHNETLIKLQAFCHNLIQKNHPHEISYRLHNIHNMFVKSELLLFTEPIWQGTTVELKSYFKGNLLEQNKKLKKTIMEINKQLKGATTRKHNLEKGIAKQIHFSERILSSIKQ